MSLSWPWALLALLVVPLLLVARWWFNRRRKRAAVTVSSIALIRAALPGRTAWRRRIPVVLFLAGLLALGGAVTRPQASVSVPSNNTTILLAIDVSGSMCNTDIAPNRLAVAADARHRDEPSAAAGVQRGDHAALGTESHAVCRVLDVAAHDDAAVVHDARNTDREPGVRRVGLAHDRDGLLAQDVPVDVLGAVGTAVDRCRRVPAIRGRPGLVGTGRRRTRRVGKWPRNQASLRS